VSRSAPPATPGLSCRVYAAVDPQVGLPAVAALRRLLEQLEALQVDNARAHGWRWSDIADAMGTSQQAVHRKHAPRLRLLRR
jgi:hypothetical protein